MVDQCPRDSALATAVRILLSSATNTDGDMQLTVIIVGDTLISSRIGSVSLAVSCKPVVLIIRIRVEFSFLGITNRRCWTGGRCCPGLGKAGWCHKLSP
jgi:hypothetical protein